MRAVGDGEDAVGRARLGPAAMAEAPADAPLGWLPEKRGQAHRARARTGRRRREQHGFMAGAEPEHGRWHHRRAFGLRRGGRGRLTVAPACVVCARRRAALAATARTPGPAECLYERRQWTRSSSFRPTRPRTGTGGTADGAR